MSNIAKYFLLILLFFGVNSFINKANSEIKTDNLLIIPSPLVLLDSTCIASGLFKEDSVMCYTNHKDDYCIHVDISASVDTLATHKVTYSWDLGDGNVKQGVKFEHCYKTYGSYKVVLRAKSQVSGITFEDVTEELVQINDIVIISPQKAGASSTQFPYYFDGTSSFINNDFELVNYYWSFDDGKYNCGEIVFHNFASKGNYEIRLIVEGISKTGKQKRICGSYALEIK